MCFCAKWSKEYWKALWHRWNTFFHKEFNLNQPMRIPLIIWLTSLVPRSVYSFHIEHLDLSLGYHLERLPRQQAPYPLYVPSSLHHVAHGRLDSLCQSWRIWTARKAYVRLGQGGWVSVCGGRICWLLRVTLNAWLLSAAKNGRKMG